MTYTQPMHRKKGIIFTILGLVALIGVLGGIKGLQIRRMISQGAQFVPPPEPVTVAMVHTEPWESLLTSVGSLVAVQGVMVTAELTGKVADIAFRPGIKVTAGDLLVKQDIASEAAQLRAAEARMALAKIDLERTNKLLAQNAIARSQNDDADARFKEAVAQYDNIRAAIAKKTIRAPFAGRLGIRLVNLGQTLNEGDAIVSLQCLDPIFVNFYLPQHKLVGIQPSLTVRVTTDAAPGQVMEGNITAINPQVDAATRNIEIQATVANPAEHLRPGMFVDVAVVLPGENIVIVIPATAVLHAPYGDSVFIVEEKDEKDVQPGKVLRQQFVRLGERRGDFVSVVSGLKEAEAVVSTGVFKLRNGQAVVVANTQAPDFQVAPKPKEG